MARLTQQYVFDRIGLWQLNFLIISDALYGFGTTTGALTKWHKTYISLYLSQNGYYINQYNTGGAQKPTIVLPKKPSTYRERIMGSLLFSGIDTRTSEQIRADEVAIKTYRTDQLNIIKQLRASLIPILKTMPFYTLIQLKMVSDLDVIINKLDQVL